MPPTTGVGAKRGIAASAGRFEFLCLQRAGRAVKIRGVVKNRTSCPHRGISDAVARTGRPGFTLIELLVVIACQGPLSGPVAEVLEQSEAAIPCRHYVHRCQ
ncbi:MAG: type II secretion system protein [Planctomycetota bacterium]